MWSYCEKLDWVVILSFRFVVVGDGDGSGDEDDVDDEVVDKRENEKR